MRAWLPFVVATVLILLWGSPAAAQGLRRPERPQALLPLYVSFATLQVLDAHSTLAAVETGAREANPVVRSSLDMPVGLFALKAGTAVGVVYLSEKLWKRHRIAAVLTMVALNSAYATIAARNYGNARRGP